MTGHEQRKADEAAIAKLHADTLLILGKAEGEEFEDDAYIAAMQAVVEARSETIKASEGGLTPVQEAQIESEAVAAIANQALKQLGKDPAKVSTEEYLVQLEEAQRKIAETKAGN
jgi:hypothetical protein